MRPFRPTALVLLTLFVAGASSSVAAPAVRLFGTDEVRKENLQPFPKWTEVLDRFKLEKDVNSAPCKPSETNKCHYTTWIRFIKDAAALDKLKQIEKVNAFMNQALYVEDSVNWGVKDYWATPGQFFGKFGDCEDYAIAKFLTLRQLGYEGDALRIVVVQDLNLKIGHAVLAVYHEGRVFILDNQIKQVVEAGSIRHYKPIFSINESHWWLHKDDKGNKP